MSSVKRIVLTGAPSSGKSSVMAEIQKRQWPHVALVPESAVVLLSGGFPAPQHHDIEQIRSFQNVILTLQSHLEQVIARQNPAAKYLVLDRARLDGAGFWSLGVQDYLQQFQVSKSDEYSRYDQIIFLGLPTDEFFEGVNERRFHNFEQSQQSEKQLLEVWSGHPNFHFVPAERDFNVKVENVLSLIQQSMLSS
ncbi:ATP-binding protein [Pseudobdellovibrio exovorus]|uniref:NadR/Ttd14 AAA domain-containing protein n=1 Tax=Pseudobdellovibrio exovorus JSS TaxID=1184267 RepID=M4V9X1_9BACT|nr:ATP-binding protein [Pseudobdellovibrio exovorus]AGH95988.1 hypothetical protein A11Q_1772 [Pseudobdellovibrio exovorus JSS]